VLVPYRDELLASSSCYVMPVMVDPERRDSTRVLLRTDHGVQSSVFYPAVHEFSIYRERFPGPPLPHTERAARSEITLPLYPHMTADDQDRVVNGLREVLAR
jgi:dTDP-4-amino-4,6-dideoxygalactose transaminase